MQGTENNLAKEVEKKLDNSQGQEAYRQLLDEIRLGKLCPRQRLTETELAARLGISRTPVREAIRQLEADGLVTHTVSYTHLTLPTIYSV